MYTTLPIYIYPVEAHSMSELHLPVHMHPFVSHQVIVLTYSKMYIFVL